MNCLTLQGKGMLRGSSDTGGSSIVCSQTSRCFETAHPFAWCVCSSGLAGKQLKEENDCFMSTFYRSVIYRICIPANPKCMSS